MKEKFSIKVNHFAAKTIDAASGSDKEKLGIATLVLIFSGAMMYAGMGTHSLLVIMSGILFIAGRLRSKLSLLTGLKRFLQKIKATNDSWI